MQNLILLSLFAACITTGVMGRGGNSWKFIARGKGMPPMNGGGGHHEALPAASSPQMVPYHVPVMVPTHGGMELGGAGLGGYGGMGLGGAGYGGYGAMELGGAGYGGISRRGYGGAVLGQYGGLGYGGLGYGGLGYGGLGYGGLGYEGLGYGGQGYGGPAGVGVRRAGYGNGFGALASHSYIMPVYQRPVHRPMLLPVLQNMMFGR